MAVERNSRGGRIRKIYLVAWLLAIVAMVLVAIVQIATGPCSPSITIIDVEGHTRSVSLESIERMPSITRHGVYQNQYGNWRDEGIYTGVLLIELIGRGRDYEAACVVAEDGYEVTIDRTRLEDPDFPVVLAYALDGVSVPTWDDGFRIAILPEDGDVGNEEYGVESAGSYWVKNVVRIALLSFGVGCCSSSAR